MTNKETGEELSVNILARNEIEIKLGQGVVEIKRARKKTKNWSESDRNFKIFDLQSFGVFCVIFIMEYLVISFSKMLKIDVKKLKNHAMPITGIFCALLMSVVYDTKGNLNTKGKNFFFKILVENLSLLKNYVPLNFIL